MKETFKKTAHGSNIAKSIILLASTRDGKIEDNNPGDANLSPHFQINGTKTGIKCSAHEEIINGIARHADRSLRDNGMNIGNDRNTETIDHGNGHEMTVVIDDLSKAEDTSPVEGEGHNYCGVPTLKGVAVVHEGFIAQRRDRETLLLEARKNPGDEELEEEVAGVHLPSIEVGTSILSMALSY